MARPIARAVPDGAARTVPDAAFAPALHVAAGTGALDEILALLGRRPGQTSGIAVEKQNG